MLPTPAEKASKAPPDLRRSPRSGHLVKLVQLLLHQPQQAKDDTGEHQRRAAEEEDHHLADGVSGLAAESPAKPSAKLNGKVLGNGEGHHQHNERAEFALVAGALTLRPLPSRGSPRWLRAGVCRCLCGRLDAAKAVSYRSYGNSLRHLERSAVCQVLRQFCCFRSFRSPRRLTIPILSSEIKPDFLACHTCLTPLVATCSVSVS